VSSSSSQVAAPTRLSRVDFATMAITFFSLGVTLQVLLIDNGTSSTRALVASVVIFSATSQFAYLAVRDGGGGDWAAIAAGWVVATRFGILAVSLSSRLPQGFWRRAVASINAFDPNVAVAVQQTTPREVEREFWRTTAGMMLGWFSGLAVGTLLGNVLGDTQRLGLDAIFPAALLAIIGNLLRRRDGFIAGIAGAATCLVLLPIVPAGLPIIVSVFGVAISLIMVRVPGEPRTRRSESASDGEQL
jgi:predicted branched-subunit amino acid permease